jgi:hypothetical protein
LPDSVRVARDKQWEDSHEGALGIYVLVKELLIAVSNMIHGRRKPGNWEKRVIGLGAGEGVKGCLRQKTGHFSEEVTTWEAVRPPRGWRNKQDQIL